MEKKEELSERDRIYQSFQQQNAEPPVEEKKEEVKEEIKEVAEPAPEAAVQPEEAEKKEEAKPEVKEPPKKEHTQVSHAALHEERLKRQAEAQARKEAEARAKALEEEVARLKSTEKTNEEITDYDREILELKRWRQAQENLEKQRQEREQLDAQQKARESFDRTMEEIDRELSEEGFGGFTFAQDRVAREIARMIHEDESNKALDTKEGWKQIYRETVYPNAAKVFAEANQKREKLNKEELKKQANIHTPPGSKPPSKPKPDSEKTKEELNAEYIKMRRGE